MPLRDIHISSRSIRRFGSEKRVVLITVRKPNPDYIRWANTQGRMWMFRLLLTQGYDVNMFHLGWPMLVFALEAGNDPLCTYLLSAGAHFLPCDGYLTFVRYMAVMYMSMMRRRLLQHGAPIYENGVSLLHEVASIHSSYDLKSLLDEGFDVNEQESDGGTPLHRVLRYYNHAFNKPVLDLLISRGADPTIRNHKGQTPADVTVDDDIRELLKIYFPT